jgi:hypothetical protein
MKDNYPVEMSEYAKKMKIDKDPLFVWSPYILEKRDVILSSVKVRVRRFTHKYGIEVPTSIHHAIEIDKANINVFWKDAISLEMDTIVTAFDICLEGSEIPGG